MAVPSKLKAFFTKAKIKVSSQRHPVAYTAQEIAAAQHVSGKQLAKCVLVKTDKGFALAVLPAVQLIDFDKLKKILKVKTLTIAKEADIKASFPGIEVGAMSVFGSYAGVPTVLEKTLTALKDLVCNAGTHTDTIKVKLKDLERVEKPKIGVFGVSASGPVKRKRK